MTVTELKRRLQPGVQVHWTWAHYSGPMDRYSTVERQQTRDIVFREIYEEKERNTRLSFGKGKTVEETDTGFRIIEDGNTTLIGEWVLVGHEHRWLAYSEDDKHFTRCRDCGDQEESE